MARVREVCATAREWAGVGPWWVEVGLAAAVLLAQVAVFARTDLSAATPLVAVGMQRYAGIRAAISVLTLVAHALAHVRLLAFLLLALALGGGVYTLGMQPGTSVRDRAVCLFAWQAGARPCRACCLWQVRCGCCVAWYHWFTPLACAVPCGVARRRPRAMSWLVQA